MTTDPFGDTEDFHEEVKKEIKTMKAAESGKGEVVGTLKGGAGYDAPWLVIHAADIEDLRDTLVNNADAVDQTLRALWDASSQFKTYGASKPQAVSTTAPAGATEAPGGETRTCSHGQMVYRAGIAAKTGKPYRLFGCPHPDRAMQCKAIFL